MSSVQEKTFLRLIKFSYDLSLKVTRTFTRTNILHNYNNSFVTFLESYKHELFHLWNNTTRCCACPANPVLKQYRELNKEQFRKLYDIKGNTSPGHFKKGTGKFVIQHCLCGVTCISTCSLNDLDITLIHTIIRKCVKLSQDDDMWLNVIREIRNNLAHAISTTCFDQGRLEKWWMKLEGSVLGLAGKVPFDSYVELIEDQIKLLEIADLDKNAVKKFLCQISEENTKILSKQEDLNKDVKQKMEDIKEEIIHHVDKNRDTFMIDIKNLMFEAKTKGMQQEIQGNARASHMQDADTCYVEWRLKNPDHWQVEDMKEKLHHFKSLFQGCFKLEFVYVGSLVIETSVNRQVITDMDLLIPAVKSFLETMVDVCKIDTETLATVHINLSVIKQLHEDKSDACILYRKPGEEKRENTCLEGTIEQTHTTGKWRASDNTLKQEEPEDRDITQNIHSVKDELNTSTDNPMNEDIMTEERQNQATHPVESLKPTHTIQERQSDNEKTIILEVDQGLGIDFCDLCKSHGKEVSSISWCPVCNVTLCEDCVHNHTEDHRTVDVDLKLDLQLIKSQEYCPKHVQQKVEYYCPVHDFICCQTCLDNKHKSCEEVISLDVACKNANRSTILEELRLEMNTMNKSLASLEEEVNTNISDINTECQGIESQIVEVKAKAIHQINESETILLLELQDEKRKIITEQQKVKEKCQIISEKLVLRSNVTQFIEEHGTDKQAFIMANHLKPAVDEIDGSVTTILSNTTRTKLAFDVILSIPMLGRINSSAQEKYAQCIVPRANRPLTSFKLVSTFITSHAVCITGMIVTDDNKLLLCNFKRPEVLVYNDDGQYISSITMKGDPWDIAVIPGGDQYVVTLPITHGIQYINSRDLTPETCVKLRSDALTYGVAADKQHIYFGEYNRILVVNHDGSVVRKIILEEFGYVLYLAVNDNYLYASRPGNNIYCIDHKNNKIWKIKEIEYVNFIRKIVINRQGNIYVGGEESGKVHRLDKELNETMTIGDDSVTKIATFSFNKNCSKLFVASKEGQKIAVFSCS